jgi:hypothetical protein
LLIKFKIAANSNSNLNPNPNRKERRKSARKEKLPDFIGSNDKSLRKQARKVRQTIKQIRQLAVNKKKEDVELQEIGPQREIVEQEKEDDEEEQVRELGLEGAEYEQPTSGTRQGAAPRTNNRTGEQTGVETNNRGGARMTEERTGKEETGTGARHRREQKGEMTTGYKGTREEMNSTADRPKTVTGTYQRKGTGTAHKGETDQRKERTRGPGRGAETEVGARETGARDPNPDPQRSPPWVTRKERTTANPEKDPRRSRTKKPRLWKERTGTSPYRKKPKDQEPSRNKRRREPPRKPQAQTSEEKTRRTRCRN